MFKLNYVLSNVSLPFLYDHRDQFYCNLYFILQFSLLKTLMITINSYVKLKLGLKIATKGLECVEWKRVIVYQLRSVASGAHALWIYSNYIFLNSRLWNFFLRVEAFSSFQIKILKERVVGGFRERLILKFLSAQLMTKPPGSLPLCLNMFQQISWVENEAFGDRGKLSLLKGGGGGEGVDKWEMTCVQCCDWLLGFIILQKTAERRRQSICSIHLKCSLQWKIKCDDRRSFSFVVFLSGERQTSAWPDC